MLVSALLLLQAKTSGIDRFEALMKRTQSFSVEIKASLPPNPLIGKATLLLVKPGNLRLTAKWGPYDYTFVKNSVEAVEWENARKIYQPYPSAASLVIEESMFSGIAEDVFPIPLFAGNLRSFVPKGLEFKLTSAVGGNETYVAAWGGASQSAKITATIGSDGRLQRYDSLMRAPDGIKHLVWDFSNYNFKPQVSKETFRAVPPAGYAAFALPSLREQFGVGSTLKLGNWKSASGSVELDPLVRRKLLIVRQPVCPPSDALLAFLGGQKLPVETVVVSIGASGGEYWSPRPDVARTMGSMGTPLLILLDGQGKVTWMSLGFDPDNTKKLLDELTAAAKEKSR